MRDVLGSVRRPDVWLPVAGMVVASALIVLGAAASRALEDRHAVALEGRTLRLAQQIERELREGGPAAVEDVLGQQFAGATGLVVGLALLDNAGNLQARVGELPADETWDVDLHLGRVWHGTVRQRGGMSGRRVLRIAIDPAARGQAASERLLLPVTVFSGLVLAALSALGGRLLERQQREQQNLAMQRRLEGLARAGAGLAHQLRTPLATIKGSCQLLLERHSDEQRLQAVVSQTERMETMLQQLLDYARPPAAEPAEVDLELAVRELANFDAERVRPRVATGLEAWVDPEHLREILSNLIDNGLRVSDDAVDVGAEAEGRGVEIRITDRGPGPGDDPESLFEPYVTRRADGTGLGLPIARSLAEANGGRLELVARLGGGTSAVLRLPRAEPTG